MLHYRHNKGLIVLFIFSSPDNWFSRCPRQSEGGVFRESNFAPVFCCQVLVLAAEFQSVLHVFLERSGFFGALLDRRLLSKSLCLTEPADALASRGKGLALAGHSETSWSCLHCSGASLFEVLDDPESGYFRCDILCSNLVASTAILMQSDDVCTLLAHKHNNLKHFFPPQQSLCSYNRS